MPNTLLRTELTEFLRRVDVLAAAGVAPPRAFTELRDRFERYRAMPPTAAQRLADALIHPTKTDDAQLLYAHAVAEQIGQDMPGIQAKVDQHVFGVIEAKLRELYAVHAKAIYGRAADRFNEAAAAFTAAAQTVDIATTDANDVAKMADDQRAAWAAAPTLTVQLDHALPILTVAAELAGKVVNPDDGGTLALCVDTAGADKRALWAAWETDTGRCGRWGAIIAAGAPIRACDLDTFTPYTRPKPIETRLEPEPGAPRGYYREVAHDPEAPGYQPPAAPERAMIPGRRMIAR